jgi:hypothetical protein
MRLRLVVLLNALAIATLAGRTAAAQQNALSGFPISSDSSSSSRRSDATTRPDESKDSRRDPADRARVTLPAVRVSGRPGSLEVVGVPVPSTLGSADEVRYRIVPVAGARVIGRTEGILPSGRSRPRSVMVTVSSPATSVAGKVRVASAEFDGPPGTQPLEVPIEMTVLAVRRVEVTIIDQVVGTRRGDVATIRFRAVNFGNVADSVRFTAELPSGWRLSGNTSQAIPNRGTADGSVRVWVPQEAAAGTSFIRLVAKSGGAIVAAVDVHVEVESPNRNGGRGPRLTVGSAFTSLGGGPVSSAYVATLDGQLSDSVAISATGAWAPVRSPAVPTNDLALVRLGVPMTEPSLQIIAPSVQLGFGLTSRSLSELTGTFVTGNGVSLGGRIGGWQISGIEARPYTNSFGAVSRDTLAGGTIQSGRIEHAVGESNVFITASHLDNPFEHRKLDAASMGASFTDGPLDGFTSELGYRRAAATSGLGWSSELRRQGDDGALYLRAVYAPGGAQAYARSTSEITASATRKVTKSLSLNAGFWQSGDRSGTIGTSGGDGWSIGPSFAFPSIGTNLTLQARGSSVEVNGDGGRFGSDETRASALVDVRRGALFFNGSAGIGQTSRTISTDEAPLPTTTGMTSDARGSVGFAVNTGTLRGEVTTQSYSSSVSAMPRQTTLALRAEHIAIPVTDRLRLYANVELERVAFALGDQSPWGKRVSLTAPLGLGFDVTALAEQSPFITNAVGATPWMTAIRIERSMYLPRAIAAGESHTVFRDLNGNSRRDRGETGVPGLIVRCGDQTAVTDGNGRFRCTTGDGWSIDPASLPMGWVAPASRADRRASRDVGLIEMKAIEVQIDLADVDTIRVTRADLAKLIVMARDSAGQPWFARTLSPSRFVFDALPPGRYTVDVDPTAIDEPLRMRGTPEFTVGPSEANDVRVTLTGRALKIRALPPTQSAGPAGSDAPGKSSSSSTGRSTAKEIKQ